MVERSATARRAKVRRLTEVEQAVDHAEQAIAVTLNDEKLLAILRAKAAVAEDVLKRTEDEGEGRAKLCESKRVSRARMWNAAGGRTVTRVADEGSTSLVELQQLLGAMSLGLGHLRRRGGSASWTGGQAARHSR